MTSDPKQIHIKSFLISVILPSVGQGAWATWENRSQVAQQGGARAEVAASEGSSNLSKDKTYPSINSGG